MEPAQTLQHQTSTHQLYAKPALQVCIIGHQKMPQMDHV